MAAASLWATLWGKAARAWSPRFCTSFASAAAGAAWPPCASASARGCPPPSRRSELFQRGARRMALVDYEVKDGVAVLTLNDPPANTYSHAMMQQLDEAVLKARFDEGVHVLVLTGAGKKFFCAGA